MLLESVTLFQSIWASACTHHRRLETARVGIVCIAVLNLQISQSHFLMILTNPKSNSILCVMFDSQPKIAAARRAPDQPAAIRHAWSGRLKNLFGHCESRHPDILQFCTLDAPENENRSAESWNSTENSGALRVSLQHFRIFVGRQDSKGKFRF